MTLIGNRPEWVMAMVACFRIGAVALPCNEQLRAHDLCLRLAAASPQVILADERDLGELSLRDPPARCWRSLTTRCSRPSLLLWWSSTAAIRA